MHDVVIIGDGHNGLVCSAYLAMAGLKVVVLDQRRVVGGAAVTEEFSPGFSNSAASYTVSLLNPRIRDLKLGPMDCASSNSDRRLPAVRGWALPEGRRWPNETRGGVILGAGCGSSGRL